MAKRPKNAALAYIDAVLEERVVVGKLVRLAIERHVLDLASGVERGLYFDPKMAQKAVDFFPFCRHSKGEWFGRPFVPEPWQAAMTWITYGWMRERDNTRRFRMALASMARKNGKSATGSTYGLYHLAADGEFGAEVYSLGNKYDQARYTFDPATKTVRASQWLSQRLRVLQHAIVCEETDGRFSPLCSDAHTLDGLNVSAGLLDELHECRDRELWDKIATATAARRQPILWGFSTAGNDWQSFFGQFWRRSVQVLEQGGDDEFAPFIFTLDDDDDWRNPEVWIKANPNLNVSVKLADLESKCKRAIDSTSEEAAFRRYHCNQWTESLVKWISDDTWMRGDVPVDPKDFYGRPCFAGLDLAATTDLSSLVLVFPDSDGGFDVVPFVWIPEEQAARRSATDRVPYQIWANHQLVRLTEGDVTDYRYIRRDINELAKQYNIRGIAADRWNATQLICELEGDGLSVCAFGQGYASMTAPTKQLERLVIAGKIRHGGHPVLRWCIGNTMVETDDAGNLKPSKKKSTERIDPVVSLIMALGIASVAPPIKTSVYEHRGILSVDDDPEVIARPERYTEQPHRKFHWQEIN